jgi:hypothetical protein
VTVRTHVLDHLAWIRPGESFEIITPQVRVQIPTDILNAIWGGRFSIVDRELAYNQVDLRISIIDRSQDQRLNTMFFSHYPNGEILAPIIEIRLELVNALTGEVFFTAHELSAPIRLTFVNMNNAGHLRPAAVKFQRAWLEFVPYRNLSPNEITIRTIFPGTQTIMHNRVHFDDVYNAHWGFLQSYTAAYSGLTVPMDLLHPNTPITRGEFAQLLSLTLQLPRADASRSGFVDVPLPNVFFDGVSRLFNAGLLGPYTSGAHFSPNALITREEITAIAGMALLLGEPERIPESRPISLIFTDGWLFSPHHRSNAQVAVDYRVMVGYPDNTFRPNEPATRIHALQAVMRLARAMGLLDEI